MQMSGMPPGAGGVDAAVGGAPPGYPGGAPPGYPPPGYPGGAAPPGYPGGEYDDQGGYGYGEGMEGAPHLEMGILTFIYHNIYYMIAFAVVFFLILSTSFVSNLDSVIPAGYSFNGIASKALSAIIASIACVALIFLSP